METRHDSGLLGDEAHRTTAAGRPVLAGLKARGVRQKRRRVAISFAAVLTAVLIAGVAMRPSREPAPGVVVETELPAIPFSVGSDVFISLPVDFTVDRVTTPPARSLRALVNTVADAKPLARPARKRPKAAGLDVAILSVLVEHIDAERRALSPD